MPDRSDLHVRRGLGIALFYAITSLLGLAAWEGFHPDWSKVVTHAVVVAVVVGLIVCFSEDDGLDEEDESLSGRFDGLRIAATYVVFAGLLAWALSGDELPNVAIYALTLAGVFVLAHLVGIVVRRRRERDSLGL